MVLNKNWQNILTLYLLLFIMKISTYFLFQNEYTSTSYFFLKSLTYIRIRKFDDAPSLQYKEKTNIFFIHQPPNHNNLINYITLIF